MTDVKTINDPSRSVTVDYPHRGDIRCRRLIVTKSGSVMGSVDAAESVKVDGRVSGTVFAPEVIIAVGGRLYGAVNADKFGKMPESEFFGHSAPYMPAPPNMFSRTAEEAIQRGVEQAARAAAMNAAPRPAGVGAAPVKDSSEAETEATLLDELDATLAEAIDALRLESGEEAPVPPEPAPAAALAAGRRTLPSLV